MARTTHPNVSPAVLVILVLVITFALSSPSSVKAQQTPQLANIPLGTAFTYQGQLQDGGSLVNGSCDFEFSLWDNPSAGVQLGSTQSLPSVSVSEGQFTVTLNQANQFGATAFDGNARWLKVNVRCPSGSGTFTALVPRQFIAASPYATFATRAGSIPWNALTGTPGGFADGIDNDTTYSAGAGLSLGSNVFSVNFAGTGVAITTARSDHNHGGQSWFGTGDYGLSVQNLGNNSGASGVRALAASPTGVGLYGLASSTTGHNMGVFGFTESASGVGVAGFSTATTGTAVAVSGISEATQGVGVDGFTTATSGTNYGVRGGNKSANGYGVAGDNFATSGNAIGVYGTTSSPTGWAGYFDGDVFVAGTLVKPVGSFRIDHPLDPENKYLAHSFVESPDMMNIYNGNVALDSNGQAWVQMPAWFEALNKDFRYQLTPIGAPGPNLYVAETIQGNQFKIAGGTPGMTVSWQVTGVRHDPYAEAHRIIVEEEKSPEERGLYQNPQEWNQPAERGINFERSQTMMNAQAAAAAAAEQSATIMQNSQDK